MPSTTYSYKFRVLSSELRLHESKFVRSIMNVIQLLPAQFLPTKTYILLIGNDYCQNGEHFGPDEWIMNALLKSLITSQTPLIINFTTPLENLNIEENDSIGVEQYTFKPARLQLNYISSMEIRDNKDLDNYFIFRKTKNPTAGENLMSQQSIYPPATEDIKKHATPFLRTLFSRKDLTYESNGKFYGNFSTSYTGACGGGPNWYTIEKGSVVSQTELPSACSNGEKIIMFDCL